MRFFLQAITFFLFPAAALGNNLYLWGSRGGLQNTASYMYTSSKYSELYAWVYTGTIHIIGPMTIGFILWAVLWLFEYVISTFIISPLWKQARVSTTWNP